MATETQPGQSGVPDAGPPPDERWQRAWSHREHLLKVARRRSMSMEDAEDAVHEAMLRAAEQPHLDHERLGAWLTTVTIRLCVDRHRQVGREAEVHTRPRLHPPAPVPVDEAVCDRAEARWLAVRSGELPARQAEALWLKSEDLDVGEVAVKMGLSYRTVESLLARARRSLRNSLAATLGVVLWLCGRARPRTGTNTQAVAVASTAVTLAAAVLVLPHVPEGPSGTPRPASPAVSSEKAAAPSPDRGPTAAPSPLGAGPSDGGARPSSPSDAGLPVPPLPELPLETAGVPAVPEVPVPEVPDLPSPPDLPREAAGAPSAPDVVTPSAPDVVTPSVSVTGVVPTAP